MQDTEDKHKTMNSAPTTSDVQRVAPCYVCTDCKGTGLQTFNGLADTFKSTCNFCGGHGTREEQLKWFDYDFKERGLTANT